MKERQLESGLVLVTERLTEAERQARKERNRLRRYRRLQRITGGSMGASVWMARAKEAHRERRASVGS